MSSYIFLDGISLIIAIILFLVLIFALIFIGVGYIEDEKKIDRMSRKLRRIKADLYATNLELQSAKFKLSRFNERNEKQ